MLQGDNVNQRGLKAMLGGTELILKKDKNELESELVREEWMNKPEEEMNDEERAKFEEFLEKEREFKEKRRKAWEQELTAMRDRMNDCRNLLADRLAASGHADQFDHIRQQRGMFSYLGVSVEQVRRLREEFSIYMVDSSRINIAGVNQQNLDYLADALAAVSQ